MEVSQETNQNSNITGNNQVIQKKLEQIEKRKIKKKKISQEAFLLLSVCLITLFISLMMIVVVEGNSMNPSLFPGDMLLVLKNPKQYTSNDVVLVKKKAVDRIWIKRIIGVPGDEIMITEDGRVLCNGKEEKEGYGITKPGNELRYLIKLEREEYFVMGDNRENSADSRTFGVIKRNELKGKAILLFWRRI